MFELKHLRSIKILDETASMKSAANALAMSQSALSHQLKELEFRLGQRLFERNTVPIQWSASGQKLLQLAHEVLPKIESLTKELKPTRDRSVKLTISIACHACFQWLFAQIPNIEANLPELTLEFEDVTFDQLTNGIADLLLTDEKLHGDKFHYAEIGTFELLTVVPNNQYWREKTFVQAQDFSGQTLLTYPVPKQRLDVFNELLTPNKVAPQAVKAIANTHVILQMIANEIGIAALPSWVFSPDTPYTEILRKSIGVKGLHKSLYVRYTKNHAFADLISQLVPEIVSAFKAISASKVILPRSPKSM